MFSRQLTDIAQAGSPSPLGPPRSGPFLLPPPTVCDQPTHHLPEADPEEEVQIFDMAADSEPEEAGDPPAEESQGTGPQASGSHPEDQDEQVSVSHLSKVDQFILRKRKKILDELLEGEITESTSRRIRILTYQIQTAEGGPPTAATAEPQQQQRQEVCSDSPELTSDLTAGHILNINSTTDHTLIWCSRCGSLSTGKRLVHLRQQCEGRVRNNYSRDRLRYMDRDLHPYTRQPLLGTTRRVKAADLVNRHGGNRVKFSRMYSSCSSNCIDCESG